MNERQFNRKHGQPRLSRRIHYGWTWTHLINVPQLVNEHAGVRVAVGSCRRRHCRYGELRIVPLRHQTRIRYRLCVSANNEKICEINWLANDDMHVHTQAHKNIPTLAYALRVSYKTFWSFISVIMILIYHDCKSLKQTWKYMYVYIFRTSIHTCIFRRDYENIISSQLFVTYNIKSYKKIKKKENCAPGSENLLALITW